MANKKLGRPTDQRNHILRNLVSEFFWNSKIETTYARAQEVRRQAEKLLTLAIKSYEDSVKVTKTVKQVKFVKGKDGKKEKTYVTKTVEFTNDGPKKLSARRRIMANTRDLQEPRVKKENKTAYKLRTGAINHPLTEKIFNELAPKYAARAEEKGQGGGYTRILRKGFRRGDNAEVVILEFVD